MKVRTTEVLYLTPLVLLSFLLFGIVQTTLLFSTTLFSLYRLFPQDFIEFAARFGLVEVGASEQKTALDAKKSKLEQLSQQKEKGLLTQQEYAKAVSQAISDEIAPPTKPLPSPPVSPRKEKEASPTPNLKERPLPLTPREKKEQEAKQQQQAQSPISPELAPPPSSEKPVPVSASPAEAKSIKRQHIMNELLETERAYVKFLYILSSHYIQRMKQLEVVPASVHKSVFGEIEVIIGVNETFLKQLEEVLEGTPEKSERRTKEMRLADHILYFAKTFKLYSGYITGYKKATDTLIKEQSTNANFKQFLQEQRQVLKKQSVRIQDLSGFLILPIQRIPRYRLLLEDLLKNMENKQSEEYTKLEQAVKLVCEVAAHCNLKEREYENMKRFSELKHSLGIKNLTQPGRVFLKDNSGAEALTRYNSSSQKLPTDIYLFNDLLIIVKRGGKLLVPKTYQIRLQEEPAELEKVERCANPTDFKLIFGKAFTKKVTIKDITLSCADADDCDKWVKELEACIH